MAVNVEASAVNLIQSDFRWDRRKVLALITSVEEFFEDFYDRSMKKKCIWNNVAEHMHRQGYTCTSIACEKKWRDLKNNYAHMLLKQGQDDATPQFEYFDALHHILGQEVEPSDPNDQIVSPDEASDSDPDEPAEPVECTDSTNYASEVGAVAKIKVIPEKELISISDQKDGSFSKTSRSKTGQGKAALGRVKHIESSMSIQDRLERLETNVASVKQQRESVRKTNVLLGQVLTELRRINAALKQEESIQGVHTVHAQHPDSVSCSPTNQEFIIVEAYADHL